MKLITNNKPLIIRSVKEDLENVEVINYKEGVSIVKADNEYFMIIKSIFNNSHDYLKKENRAFYTGAVKNASFEVLNLKSKIVSGLKLNYEYGDKDSIIVDMHGIDNFRFAKSLVFNDSTVRKIILKMNLLENKKYFRFGCSGARESSFHPGGEVYESSIINGIDRKWYLPKY